MLILIVEDDVDGGETLASLIEDFGHEVKIATTAEAALALTAATAPDVAFIDFLLPDMHGIELATRLREVAPASALVAVTGMVSPEHKARALEAGFRRYLGKPYNIEQIEEILAEVERRDQR